MLAKLWGVTFSSSAFSGMLTISTPQLHLDFIRRLMHHLLWETSLCCTSRDHRRKRVHQSNRATPLKWSVTAEKAKFVVGDGAAFLSAGIRRRVEQICSEDAALIRSFTSPSDRQQQQLCEAQGPQESFINSLFFRNCCRRSHFSFREADSGSSGTNVGIN